jgi:hypothetical protein
MYKRTETQLALNKLKNILTYQLSQDTLRDKTKIRTLKRQINALEVRNRKETIQRKIDKLEDKLKFLKLQLQSLKFKTKL